MNDVTIDNRLADEVEAEHWREFVKAYYKDPAAHEKPIRVWTLDYARQRRPRTEPIDRRFVIPVPKEPNRIAEEYTKYFHGLIAALGLSFFVWVLLYLVGLQIYGAYQRGNGAIREVVGKVMP